jgi:hypothetical protein
MKTFLWALVLILVAGWFTYLHAHGIDINIETSTSGKSWYREPFIWIGAVLVLFVMISLYTGAKKADSDN